MALPWLNAQSSDWNNVNEWIETKENREYNEHKAFREENKYIAVKFEGNWRIGDNKFEYDQGSQRQGFSGARLEIIDKRGEIIKGFERSSHISSIEMFHRVRQMRSEKPSILFGGLPKNNEYYFHIALIWRRYYKYHVGILTHSSWRLNLSHPTNRRSIGCFWQACFAGNYEKVSHSHWNRPSSSHHISPDILPQVRKHYQEESRRLNIYRNRKKRQVVLWKVIKIDPNKLNLKRRLKNSWTTHQSLIKTQIKVLY